jgi:hypothetical protein
MCLYDTSTAGLVMHVAISLEAAGMPEADAWSRSQVGQEIQIAA